MGAAFEEAVREAVRQGRRTMKMKAFYLFALSVLSLGCWLSAGFLLSSLGPDWLVALAIAAWMFTSALALAATRVSHSTWIYAGLLVLAVLSWPHSVLDSIFLDRLSLPFGLTSLTPSTAVLITLLIYSGLNSDEAWQNVRAVEGGSLKYSASKLSGLRSFLS
jgi:hypothetical protein